MLLKPSQCSIFGTDADIDVRVKRILISINQPTYAYVFFLSDPCNAVIKHVQRCNRGRICDILTVNFISKMAPEHKVQHNQKYYQISADRTLTFLGGMIVFNSMCSVVHHRRNLIWYVEPNFNR